MEHVPTLYIRNLPPEVYERLKRRAKRHGRSVNAEALLIIEAVAEREVRDAEITRRLEEISLRVDLPPDAPRPEDLIREDRDSR